MCSICNWTYELIVFSVLIFCSCVHATSSLSTVDCGRSYVGRLGDVGSIIASPNFPFNYRHNLTCLHRIHIGPSIRRASSSAATRGTGSSAVATSTSRVICFEFRQFGLETSSPFCSFDYVEIGSSPAIKYCGTGLWQYGVADRMNDASTVWSPNFCGPVKGPTFDIKFSTDNNVNGTGFYATFGVFESYPNSSSLISGVEGQAPCQPDEWTCFNRRCISAARLCDGNDDCRDGSDESYTHARCPVQNVLACDFSAIGSTSDGFCELTRDGWQRVQGSQYPYGPGGDHTNGTDGFFIYAEGSNHSALLLAPELSLSGPPSPRCLSFWFYASGKIDASIVFRVYIGREQVYSRPEWSRKNVPVGVWTKGSVHVSPRMAPLQIVFAVEFGEVFGSLALDDISVVNGRCEEPDVSCNFESGICGWTVLNELVHSGGVLESDLMWRIHNQLVSTTGPLWDRSSTDGGGSYLFVNSTTSSVSADSSSSSALLLSSLLSNSPTFRASTAKCLHFTFYTRSTYRNSCALRVRTIGVDGILGDVWKHDCDQNEAVWHDVSLDLRSDVPFQIVIEAIVLFEGKGEVAVDEMYLEDDLCATAEKVSCGRYQFACADGMCIRASLHCDGVTHCIDGSDEGLSAGCKTLAPAGASPSAAVPDYEETGADGYRCPRSTHYLCHDFSACVPREWLCDLANDCVDMSDENHLAGCLVAALPTCQYGQASCRAGQCVEEISLCDENKSVSAEVEKMDASRIGTGSIVAIVFGVIVCTLFFMLMSIFFFYRRRKHRPSPHQRRRRRGPVISATAVVPPSETIWLRSNNMSGTSAAPIVLPPLYFRPIGMTPAHIQSQIATTTASSNDMPPPYESVFNNNGANNRGSSQPETASVVLRHPGDRERSSHARRTRARLSLPPLGASRSNFQQSHRRAESDAEEHIYEDPVSLRRSQSGVGNFANGMLDEGAYMISPSGSAGDARASLPPQDPVSTIGGEQVLSHDVAAGYHLQLLAEPYSIRPLFSLPRNSFTETASFGELSAATTPASIVNPSVGHLQQRPSRILLGTTALHSRTDSRNIGDWRRSGDFSRSSLDSFGGGGGAFSPLSVIACSQPPYSTYEQHGSALGVFAVPEFLQDTTAKPSHSYNLGWGPYESDLVCDNSGDSSLHNELLPTVRGVGNMRSLPYFSPPGQYEELGHSPNARSHRMDYTDNDTSTSPILCTSHLSSELTPFNIEYLNPTCV